VKTSLPLQLAYVSSRAKAANLVCSPVSRGTGFEQARSHVSFSLFASILCFLFSLHLRAQNPESDFETANKLYEQGKFAEAAPAYQKLIQSGQISAALYFNLGNAFFKSGQIGRAIAAYRQAERLTPRDPDIRANLQFARNQTQGPTLAPSRWQLWLGKLTANEWAAFAAAAIWLCFLLLAAMQWRPVLRDALRGYSLVFAIAAAGLSLCLGAVLYENLFERTAIVLAPEVPARNGPLEESHTAFTLHDGAELRVLDQKDNWLQVTTDPRRIGWVRRDQVLLSPKT